MKALLTCLLILLGLPALAQSDDSEGGILGTGIAQVGVFGVVTGLGSIYVNGLHITYAPDMQVRTPFGATPAQAIEVGDTLAIAVRQASGGGYEAAEILAAPALVGPVTGGTVLGVPVGNYADGQWVQVSGLWQDSGLDITRVQPVTPQEFAFVQGDYRVETGQVGGVGLGGFVPLHARPFDTLRVWLHPSGGVAKVQTGLFGAGIQVMLVEGYLSDARITGEYTIRGAGVVAYQAGGGEMPDMRALFCVTPSARFDQVEMLESTGAGDCLSGK